MSFGSLKTIKLERVLGDSTLSITKHIPTDADEINAFGELDASIIEASSNLKEYTQPSIPPVIKAESKGGYPVIKDETKEVKEEVKEEPKKTRKKGAGRPKGSTKKVETKEVKEVKEEPKKVETKEVKEEPKQDLISQDDKTELIKSFQATFENEIGYASDDTYEEEFNVFLTGLISMDYKSFLEADVTKGQLKTFKELI